MNTQNTKAEGGQNKAESEKRESGNGELVPPMVKEGRERTELVAVLEGCGVSVAGFDALRSDSYEKHLAGRNLTELEAFYRRLMNLTEGYGRIRQQCLPWGIGSHHINKLPSVRTLWEIRERIQLEQAVQARMKARKLMGTLKSMIDDNDGQAQCETNELAMEYFKVAMEMLAEELLLAKLEGKPIMENLKVVDRLLKVAGLRLRERKEEREQARFEQEREKSEGGKRESGNASSEAGSENSEVRSQEPELKHEVGLVELVPPIVKEGKERTELVVGHASGLKDESVRGRERGRGGFPDTLVESQEPEREPENEVGLMELAPPMEGEEQNKAESEKRESGNEMEVRDEKPVEEPREEMRPEAVEKIEKGEGGLITRPRNVNLNVLSPMGKNLMSLTNVRDTMTGKFLTGQQLDDLQRSQGRI